MKEKKATIIDGAHRFSALNRLLEGADDDTKPVYQFRPTIVYFKMSVSEQEQLGVDLNCSFAIFRQETFFDVANFALQLTEKEAQREQLQLSTRDKECLAQRSLRTKEKYKVPCLQY